MVPDLMFIFLDDNQGTVCGGDHLPNGPKCLFSAQQAYGELDSGGGTL